MKDYTDKALPAEGRVLIRETVIYAKHGKSLSLPFRRGKVVRKGGVCIFTTGSRQLEVDRLGQMGATGEKATGKDCKGSKRLYRAKACKSH